MQDWEFRVQAPWGTNENVVVEDLLNPGNTISIIPRIDSALGVGLPNYLYVAVKFPDLTDNPVFDGFTEITFQRNVLTGNIGFFVDDNETFILRSQYAQPFVDGITGTFRFWMNAVLPINYNYTSIFIDFYGKNTNNENVLITTKSINFGGYVRESGTPFVLPAQTTYNYILNSSIVPSNFSLYASGATDIIVKPNFTVFMTNAINGVDSSGNPFVSITLPANSPAIPFTIAPTVYFNSLNPSTIDFGFFAKNVSQNFESSFLYKLKLIAEVGNYNLNFTAFKNFKEPLPLEVNTSPINGTEVVIMPTWLLKVGPTEFVPKPTAQMDAGLYSGIVHYYEQDGTTELFKIYISYALLDNATTDYTDYLKAFTLDKKFISINTANIDTYFEIETAIKTFDFYTDFQKTFTIKEKFVPFKGKEKFNIGLVIHRLMQKIETINFLSEKQYLPTQVQFTVTEKNNSNNVARMQAVSNTFQFVAGLSRDSKDIGLLDFNQKPNRATSNAIAILNYIVPKGNYKIEIKRNGQPEGFKPILVKEIVASQFYELKDYLPGDVIDFKIVNTDTNQTIGFIKQYKIYPQGKQSITIVWENEFLLRSQLECTGSFTIGSEFEHQIQKLHDNLVDHLEILDTTKEIKFTINTGWLLATDVDTVESLLRAKKVWIMGVEPKKGLSKVLASLRPLNKKMINQDVDRELIEYSLEFIINRNFNEETYSF